MAVKHQLAIFSAHTNLDIVQDGVNDVLAQRLGLRNLTVLKPVQLGPATNQDITSWPGETEVGIGRIGSLARNCSLKSLISTVKKKLKLDFVKVAGDVAIKVSRVAICSGSGSSLMQAFLSSNAQVFISGDIHYHDARQAENTQRGIIDIGHFPSEQLMVAALAQQLESILSKDGIEAEITACKIEKDPFRIF
jgi:dinuclear metal center YbgI/SA1388 family protein